MNRKYLIKQTACYLNQYEPNLHIGWLEKLNDHQLLELHDLLSSFDQDTDLIRF